MAVFYLDTSALVKRYWPEQGTELVDRLIDARTADDRFITSYLTILEVTSAAHRLIGSDRLPPGVVHEILGRFRRDLQEHFGVWPLDERILDDAVRVVGQYRLRSADAIHLATALAMALVDRGSQAVLVSADRELCAAAESAGLRVVDPLRSDALNHLDELRRPAR